MEIIYAQSRMEFIKSEKEKLCIFCKNSARNQDLVLYENNLAYIIMNKYPYNTGHLLIVPIRHIKNIEEVTQNERIVLFSLLEISIKILKHKICADGLNIGINLGKTAGAGIENHLHIHVIPRWGGDTNFMTTVACTRVIPEDVTITYQKMLSFFKKINIEDIFK